MSRLHPREIIIHAGMHKTGTSSIQQSLSKLKSPDFHYPKWRHPNLSNLFALLYHEPIEEYHAYKNEGVDIKSLHGLREYWLETFQNLLCNQDHHKIIFSAEDMSGLQYQQAVVRMKEHLEALGLAYRIILYVRPPKSLIQSSIQQLIKSGHSDIDLSTFWPCYRKRLEFFDEVFGRECVTLRKFSSDSLYEGDVVMDFANFAGIKVGSDDVVKANQSLSLEAVSVLWIQRKYGSGFPAGFSGAQRSNQLFIQQLRSLGSRKFSLSSSLIQPLIEENREDLAWIEDRIGASMSEVDLYGGYELERLEDLETIAIECIDEVASIINSCLCKTPKNQLKGIIANVEALKSHVYLVNNRS